MSLKIWFSLGLAVWVAASVPQAARADGHEPGEAPDPKRGEVLFNLCTQCHGDVGQGNPLALAPAIAGQEQWYIEAQLHKFRDGLRGAHAEDIAGLRMRPMSRSLRTADDVKHVAAYVASLPPTNPPTQLEGGNAEKGKATYAVCVQCHGAAGEGVKALNGPALVRTSDWYLFKQIANFKAGIRGSNPKDTNGALMRGMSGTIVDEQAARDVIAYIMTLRDN